MSYRLLMTEKPSVARDIADVLIGKGRYQRKRTDNVTMDEKHGAQYYEGNGLLITWAVGHLVGLAEPEVYGYSSKDEMYAKDGGGREKALSELPLDPATKEGGFRLVVLQPTETQFKAIEKLIHRPDVVDVVNCGDMGAEGHILQWFVRTKAECDKPVWRFCATSMTEEAIKEAYQHLRAENIPNPTPAQQKDMDHFANIIKGEFCKKKADWIMGMSLSRAESLKYYANISVGRVQSPTLYFVVQRYLEVNNFKSRKYYQLAMTCVGEPPFTVTYTKDGQPGVFPASIKDSEGRVLSREAVEQKASAIRAGGTATVLTVEKQKRQTDRPQLYDITELQRDANRKYGYTAQLTLDTAQALYETQKVLSYPRTDSRYITSDLQGYMKGRIEQIATIGKYTSACNALSAKGLLFGKRVVNDAEVTDHHALIVTEKINNFDLSKMMPTKEEQKKGVTGDIMRNILDLVICRMIVAFSTPFLYEQTNVIIKADDVTFKASGKHQIDAGWKGVQEQLAGKFEKDEDAEAEDEQTFPPLAQGQTLTVKNCSVVEKQTTPPKLHTEATLLTAMENAGTTVENGAILKGRGIGTQATRAGIIKLLFTRGYIENKGKSIIPTQTGIKVIRVLPKELYSPKVTADWETIIADIAEGKKNEQDFFEQFTPFIRRMTEQILTAEAKVSFQKEREAVATCPICGGKIYISEDKKKGAKNYFCGNKDCIFIISTRPNIFAARQQKEMTDKQIKELIYYGTTVINLKPFKSPTSRSVTKDAAVPTKIKWERSKYKDKNTGEEKEVISVKQTFD